MLQVPYDMWKSAMPGSVLKRFRQGLRIHTGRDMFPTQLQKWFVLREPLSVRKGWCLFSLSHKIVNSGCMKICAKHPGGAESVHHSPSKRENTSTDILV